MENLLKELKDVDLGYWYKQEDIDAIHGTIDGIERYYKRHDGNLDDPTVIDPLMLQFDLLMSSMITSLEETSQPNEGVLRYDLQTHNKVARKKGFSDILFRASVLAARKRGIDGFAYTEHMDFGDFFWNVGKIQEVGKKRVIVIPGGEINIKESGVYGGDIMVLAEFGLLQKLNEYFGSNGPRITEGYQPTFIELITAINSVDPGKENVLIVANHIFRSGQELCNINTLEDMNGVDLRLVDAIDTNLVDYQFRAETKRKAELLQKPLLYSSDGHIPLEIGTYFTIFPPYAKDLRGIIEAVKKGDVSSPKIEDEAFEYALEPIRKFRDIYKKFVKSIGKFGDWRSEIK